MQTMSKGIGIFTKMGTHNSQQQLMATIIVYGQTTTVNDYLPLNPHLIMIIDIYIQSKSQCVQITQIRQIAVSMQSEQIQCLQNPSELAGGKVGEVCQKSNVIPLRSCPPNTAQRTMKKLDRYEFSFEDRLGAGTTSNVYVGQDTQTRALVCVKVIDLQVYKSDRQKEMLDNQIRCQDICACNSILKIYDIFDTQSFCFIVTQFCDGGDLYKQIMISKTGLREEIVIHYGKDIIKGMLKLKEKGILHRDIKSENIIIKGDRCKIGDFGFAIENSKLVQSGRSAPGSPLYMAPQTLINGKNSYASDLFSLGVILYEMLHARTPWECEDEALLKVKIIEEEVEFKSGVSQLMKEAILGCLHRDQSQRWTIEKLAQCQLFKIDTN